MTPVCPERSVKIIFGQLLNAQRAVSLIDARVMSKARMCVRKFERGGLQFWCCETNRRAQVCVHERFRARDVMCVLYERRHARNPVQNEGDLARFGALHPKYSWT